LATATIAKWKFSGSNGSSGSGGNEGDKKYFSNSPKIYTYYLKGGNQKYEKELFTSFSSPFVATCVG
jgi:hypothetical protein